MSKVDWRAVMQAGFGRLRLTPETFWRLTPAELALLLGHDVSGTPLTRDRLDALSRAFPDRAGD